MRTLQSSRPTDSLSTPDLRRAFRTHPIATLLATGLGVGLSSWAPGTAGSAAALFLSWLLARAIAAPHQPSLAAGVGLLVSGLLIGAAGIPLSTRASRAIGAKDPGCIVVDEFAGQFLASAAVPLFRYASFSREACAWIASFLFFRLFDIWKPGPIRRLQDLPEGWGIVVDDLLSGACAFLCTALLALWLGSRQWI